MSELPSGCVLHKGGAGIDMFGWSISCTKMPIATSQAVDDFYVHTKVKCPEMVYLSNRLVLTHTSGASFTFSTPEALMGCLFPETIAEYISGTTPRDAEPKEAGLKTSSPVPIGRRLPQPLNRQNALTPSSSIVRVASAVVWDDKVAHGTEVIEQVPMNYDWTYTTAYLGSATILNDGKMAEPITAIPTTQELDMELLKRRDPVYWFDHVLLYEDELHDNGISHVSVKVRVMPTFWLVLLRSWLRVDGVVIRVKDVRVFHKFGTTEVFREVQSREVTFADMPKYRLPMDVSLYRDVDQFSHRIPLQNTVKHVFHLGPSTTPHAPCEACVMWISTEPNSRLVH